MKKSVILTILAVYVVSIVVVGLLGIMRRVYDEKQYIQAIEVIDSRTGDYTLEPQKNTGKMWIRLEYRKGMRFKIDFKTSPDDLKDPQVEFVYEKDKGIEIDQDGNVTILCEEDMLTSAIVLDITVRPADGGGGSQYTVGLYIRNPITTTET